MHSSVSRCRAATSTSRASCAPWSAASGNGRRLSSATTATTTSRREVTRHHSYRPHHRDDRTRIVIRRSMSMSSPTPTRIASRIAHTRRRGMSRHRNRTVGAIIAILVIPLRKVLRHWRCAHRIPTFRQTIAATSGTRLKRRGGRARTRPAVAIRLM